MFATIIHRPSRNCFGMVAVAVTISVLNVAAGVEMTNTVMEISGALYDLALKMFLGVVGDQMQVILLFWVLGVSVS